MVHAHEAPVTMTPTRGFLLFAVVLVTVMAGCLLAGPAATDEDSAAVTLALVEGRCDPRIVVNCDRVAQDPDSPYVIQGLRLINAPDTDDGSAAGGDERQTADPSVGLHVSSLDRSLIVRDAEVRGYQGGIRIEGIRCPDCSVRVLDARLEAGPCSAFGRNFTCEDLRTSEASVTLYLYAEYEGITVDVERGEVDVEVKDTVVRGFPTGIGVSGPDDPSGRVALKNVTLSCKGDEAFGFFGAWATNMRRVDLDGLTATECPESGVRLRSAKSAELVGLTVSASGTGVVVRETQSLEMRDFTVQSTDHGVRLDDVAMASISDGRILENRAWGLITLGPPASELHARRVSFLRNGQPDEPFGGNTTGALVALGDGSVTVRQSSFEGNSRWGAVAEGGALIDGRWNWWNSPTGPRVKVPLAPVPPVGIGGGDTVNERVFFVPHLTSAPDGAAGT